jgi:hypothetical protein
VTVIGALLLSALAGLNPWVVLVIATGLASFTRHAPLNSDFAPMGTTAGIAVFAAILGVDVVVSKLRRAARFVEPVSMAASAVAGALLPLALVPNAEPWYALPGLLLAAGIRFLRHRSARVLNQWLRPFGHVAASIFADLLAGCLTAAVFAAKP